MSRLEIVPRGPFSLAAAAGFAGGFPAGLGAHDTGGGILMAFPVEGWRESAALDVWQTPDGVVHGAIAGASDTDAVRIQVARSLSLDHDGTAWGEIAERDPVLGVLAARYDFLRPVCFYSAYEAATSFVIGQRIAMHQARVIKERLSLAHGDPIEIGGRVIHPFPRPERLVDLMEAAGLSSTKVQRVRDLARAALDGRLDTERLRAMGEAEALASLETLPGIGSWTASAVLTRGCGLADALPIADEISREAVAWAYDLPEAPDDATWSRIAEPWRPHRMWAMVLLHMAWRREGTGVPSYRQGDRRRPRSAGS